MILQALNSYYERLASDPNEDVAPFGFSRQTFSFCVVISSNGDLEAIEPLGTWQGKKFTPERLIVPGTGARSGATPKPFLLWDNPLYIFGIPPVGRDDAWADLRFHEFRNRQKSELGNLKDPGAKAFIQFMEKSKARDLPEGIECPSTYSGVFRLSGHKEYLHERKAIHEFLLEQVELERERNKAVLNQCLATGKTLPLATVHFPKIKGIFDKPSAPSEKYLVAIDSSFTAAESYGKKSNGNAPISTQAAFQYCTALNKLLADRTRRVQIGDSTVVFWTEQSSGAEDMFGYAMGTSPENEALVKRLDATLSTIAQGRYPSEFGAPETPFYVLGLSPNAARISVRFWYVSTLGEMVAHLHQHYADLQIVKQDKDPEWIAPWQILRETAREAKEISPILSGALTRSILTGQPYPNLLLGSIIRRIRADRSVRYLRAAVIKACLNRDTRFNLQPLKQELGMSLDPEREDPPYRLGRLFAELEKTQEDANPGINSTITDRFFSAASATPGSVFPRLIRSSKHHLAKLEEGSRRYHERRIQQIFESLDHFPAHMNLKDQGLFAIGYYHQRQDIFTKKSTKADSGTSEE